MSAVATNGSIKAGKLAFMQNISGCLIEQL